MSESRRRHDIAPTSLTYSEVGATLSGELPRGYRHFSRSRVIGAGPDSFRTAADRLMAWGMQRGAGLRVDTSSPVAAEGVVVRVGFGVGPIRLYAPCRVVGVVDEPRRRGFAYGTLPGHPERGEELFAVSLTDDERVVAEVLAFSRHATWYARLGGPLTSVTQSIMAKRYLAALSS